MTVCVIQHYIYFMTYFKLFHIIHLNKLSEDDISLLKEDRVFNSFLNQFIS